MPDACRTASAGLRLAQRHALLHSVQLCVCCRAWRDVTLAEGMRARMLSSVCRIRTDLEPSREHDVCHDADPYGAPCQEELLAARFRRVGGEPRIRCMGGGGGGGEGNSGLTACRCCSHTSLRQTGGTHGERCDSECEIDASSKRGRVDGRCCRRCRHASAAEASRSRSTRPSIHCSAIYSLIHAIGKD